MLGVPVVGFGFGVVGLGGVGRGVRATTVGEKRLQAGAGRKELAGFEGFENRGRRGVRSVSHHGSPRSDFGKT